MSEENDFKIVREKRQDLYDINKYKLINFSFEEKNKKVYENCNLSIFVDDYCNANCKFCVAQLRYENKSKMYCKKRIQNDEEYYKRLEYVLNYIKPLDVSVSITGGEPHKKSQII